MPFLIALLILLGLVAMQVAAVRRAAAVARKAKLSRPLHSALLRRGGWLFPAVV